MQYLEYLRTLTTCPFCEVSQRMLLENEHAFLTYSFAPYHADHLLVVPKVHLEHVLDISDAVWKDMIALQLEGLRMLNTLGYENVSFLLREGTHSGKSVNHLHLHLIPNIILGDSTHTGDERVMLTDEEVATLVARFRALSKS